MSRWRTGLALAAGLYVCAVCQQVLPSRLGIAGARPDFLLTFACAVSLLVNRSQAAAAGFVTGLVHGALAGMSVAAYISSRAIAAFLASWSKELRYTISLIAVAVITFATTVIAEVLWLLISPRPGIGAFLGATIGTALYNGVLAMPMYSLLRRFVDPPKR